MSHRPGAFLVALLLSAPAFAQFRLTVLDIGQGDSTVVIAPSGCAALLDGGPTGSGAVIKSYLRAHGVTRLDFAVLSHYHLDHLGGLDEVEQGADAIPVGTMYDRGSSYSSAAYTDYANQYSGRRSTVSVGQTFSLCNEVTFTVVAVNANGISTTDENAKSVAVKISYGAFDALVGGDLTSSPDVESTVVPAVGEIELYKVHHHGSRTSSGQAFLDATRPLVSFISVGWNNSYGHPTPEAIARLQSVGSAIWKTEDPATASALGHIELQTADGWALTVTQGATTGSYTSKGAPADLTPPSVPQGVTALAAGMTAVDLSWQASTDDTGVAGYRVERSADGAAWTPIADTSFTGLSDGGLAPGSTWWYRVRAYDAAGNVSAASAAAAATTLADTTAPSAPQGTTAAAASYTSVDVSWLASTDDVGVTGYRVERSADGGASWVLAASTAATAISDDGLVAGATYWYRVSATDAAGNVSAPGAPASATTPVPPPVVTELVANGGFEGTTAGWTLGGAKPPISSTAQEHSGTASLRTGWASGTKGPKGDSWAYQTVTIPAGAASATLRFWTYHYTQETAPQDWQEAAIRSASGTVLRSLFRVTSNAQAWVQTTVDVTAWRGQSIQLWFNTHGDGDSLRTTMWVDDVSLQVQ